MTKHPENEAIRAATLVDPNTRKSFSLKDRSTRGDELFESKKDAKASLDEDALAINVLQDTLFACKGGALLVVMQGIDTAGKDGATKEAFRYTSPLGVNVFGFVKPTEEELAHDYLWRLHLRTPKRGYKVENEGVAPDVVLEWFPQDQQAGRDTQLEKAVEILMKQLPPQHEMPVRIKK